MIAVLTHWYRQLNLSWSFDGKNRYGYLFDIENVDSGSIPPKEDERLKAWTQEHLLPPIAPDNTVHK